MIKVGVKVETVQVNMRKMEYNGGNNCIVHWCTKGVQAEQE